MSRMVLSPAELLLARNKVLQELPEQDRKNVIELVAILNLKFGIDCQEALELAYAVGVALIGAKLVKEEK